MEPINMSKNEFLALFRSQVLTKRQQALNALEDRAHQQSGYAIGRICSSARWIRANELWECVIVKGEGTEYEQRIAIQGFGDEIPDWLTSGAWLDAAGTYYNRMKACGGDRIEYVPTIIQIDLRQTEEREDGGLFKLAGEFVMSRRRERNRGVFGVNHSYMEEEVTLKMLLRDTYWADRLGFSKGRVIGVLQCPDGSLEEIHERLQIRVAAHQRQCASGETPSLIDNAMSGDDVYIMADARVNPDTGYILLRHPEHFRNDAAAARIEKARRDLRAGLLVKIDGDWRYRADSPRFAAAA